MARMCSDSLSYSNTKRQIAFIFTQIAVGHAKQDVAQLLSAMQVVEQQWGADLIKSWNKHDWISLPQKIGANLAELLGAQGHEIIVADSTSVNIFKTVSAALDLRPDRHIIVSGY